MRRLARLTATVGAALAVLAAPALAGNPTPLQPAGDVGGRLVSDGRALAAWQRADGVVALVDHKRTAAEAVDLRALPAGWCSGPYDLQWLRNAGGGRLLWQCSGNDQRPLTWNAGTRSFELPLGEGSLFGVDAIGRHWIRWYHAGYHVAIPMYTNWRTGERRSDSPSTRVVPDLDSPRLIRRMCRGLRRTIQPTADIDLEGVAEGPYQYERPYGLRLRGKRLLLDRCGRRTRVLSRCPGGCSSPQLGAGVVTWGTAGRINAFVLRSGRRHSWRSPELGDVPSPVHTRRHVLASGAYNAELRGARLLIARIPGR